MVKAGFFEKGPGLPALHPRGGDCDPIDCSAFNRDVAANLFKALPAKKLAGAGDVLELSETVGVSVAMLLAGIFDKGSAGNAEPRVSDKPGQKKLDVIGIEGDVGVEIADDVEGQPFQSRKAGVEGVGLGSELAIATFGHPQQFDPGMRGGVTLHNFIGAVG